MIDRRLHFELEVAGDSVSCFENHRGRDRSRANLTPEASGPPKYEQRSSRCVDSKCLHDAPGCAEIVHVLIRANLNDASDGTSGFVHGVKRCSVHRRAQNALGSSCRSGDRATLSRLGPTHQAPQPLGRALNKLLRGISARSRSWPWPGVSASLMPPRALTNQSRPIGPERLGRHTNRVIGCGWTHEILTVSEASQHGFSWN
jgi:hypothetical protein